MKRVARTSPVCLYSSLLDCDIASVPRILIVTNFFFCTEGTLMHRDADLRKGTLCPFCVPIHKKKKKKKKKKKHILSHSFPFFYPGFLKDALGILIKGVNDVWRYIMGLFSYFLIFLVVFFFLFIFKITATALCSATLNDYIIFCFLQIYIS